MTDTDARADTWLTWWVPSPLAAVLTLMSGLCMLAVLGMNGWMSGGTDILLFGRIDGTTICILLGLATAALLSAGLTAISRQWPGQGRGLLKGFAALAWLGVLCFIPLVIAVADNRHYTPIDASGDNPGYDVIVAESSFLLTMEGQVYERDGVILTPRQGFSADDGFKPVDTGQYHAEWVGDQLLLSYAFDSSSSPQYFKVIIVDFR